MTRTEVLHPHGEAGRPGACCEHAGRVMMRARRSTSVTHFSVPQDGGAKRVARNIAQVLPNEH